MNAFIRSKAALVLVAAAQTLALGYMVYQRISLLNHGREVIAEVIPVDPRDFFRGDYVILGYDFTRLNALPVPDGVRSGDKLYVTLKPAGAPGKWDVAQVSDSYPAAVPADQVTLRGYVNWVMPKTETSSATASVRYGIESYFVPEGTGKALEQDVRERKISAVLAVGETGETAIKALIVDGKRVVEEPML